MYTYERLREENETYAGTGGVSENNCAKRFLPAFRDELTGRVELARTAEGAQAEQVRRRGPRPCPDEKGAAGRERKQLSGGTLRRAATARGDCAIIGDEPGRDAL